MAKKQDRLRGLLFLSLGAFIILSLINGGVFSEVTRSAKPTDDGFNNLFDIDIVPGYSTTATVGEPYEVSLDVTNAGTFDGSMWVQCSLLDESLHEDLLQATISPPLPTEDNCVVNEPFTQTVQVTLEGGEEGRVDFTVKAPNNVGTDNFIFCQTYEQCYVYNVDPDQVQLSHESDRATALGINITGTETVDPGDACVEASDCNTWYEFWKVQECVDGYCIDTAKNADGIDVSDEGIKAWASKNVILLVGIGIAISLIGLTMVFKQPKQPKVRYV